MTTVDGKTDSNPLPYIAAALFLLGGVYLSVNFLTKNDEDAGPRIRTLSEASQELERLEDEYQRSLAEHASNEEMLRKEMNDQYIKYVDQALLVHDQALQLAEKNLADDIESYFDSKRKWTPYFAEKANTLTNDFNAAFRSEVYRKDIRNLFHRHVVSPGQLSADLPGFLGRYLESVETSERELLAKVRERLSEFPGASEDIRLDDETFQQIIDERLDELAADVTTSTRIEGGLFVLRALLNVFVAGQVGTIGGTGGGLLEAIGPQIKSRLLKTMVSKSSDLIEQCYVDEDKHESTALRILDELSLVLVEGSAESKRVISEKEAAISSSESEAEKAKLREELGKMRASGGFGLREVLGVVRERNLEAKRTVLPALAPES